MHHHRLTLTATLDAQVFISGPYPHWILLTSRGELRTHPMSIDGSVICFATFHNVNCAHGFLYVNRQVDFFSICIALKARRKLTVRWRRDSGRAAHLPAADAVQLRRALAGA